LRNALNKLSFSRKKIWDIERDLSDGFITPCHCLGKEKRKKREESWSTSFPKVFMLDEI
jgi:hypothetical protein